MIETSNPEQYDNWNGEGGQRWVADADLRDRVLHPVASRLLDPIAVEPGMSVLDVGCGCGVTTMAMAEMVGESGRVTGVDLSEPMLGVARRRSGAADIDNVTFVHADAQSHRFQEQVFDLVISRFGTMFFSDPTTAFTNIATALRPGAGLHLATWQPLEANEWQTVPGAALMPHAALENLPSSDPTAPGMYAQSDPDRITSTLESAGFVSIETVGERVSLRVGADVEEASAYLASTGPLRAVLEEIPDGAQTSAAMLDLDAALSQYRTDEGVMLDGGIWLVSGRVG